MIRKERGTKQKEGGTKERWENKRGTKENGKQRKGIEEKLEKTERKD